MSGRFIEEKNLFFATESRTKIPRSPCSSRYYYTDRAIPSPDCRTSEQEGASEKFLNLKLLGI